MAGDEHQLHCQLENEWSKVQKLQPRNNSQNTEPDAYHSTKRQKTNGNISEATQNQHIKKHLPSSITTGPSSIRDQKEQGPNDDGGLQPSQLFAAEGQLAAEWDDAVDRTLMGAPSNLDQERQLPYSLDCGRFEKEAEFAANWVEEILQTLAGATRAVRWGKHGLTSVDLLAASGAKLIAKKGDDGHQWLRLFSLQLKAAKLDHGVSLPARVTDTVIRSNGRPGGWPGNLPNRAAVDWLGDGEDRMGQTKQEGPDSRLQTAYERLQRCLPQMLEPSASKQEIYHPPRDERFDFCCIDCQILSDLAADWLIDN